MQNVVHIHKTFLLEDDNDNYESHNIYNNNTVLTTNTINNDNICYSSLYNNNNNNTCNYNNSHTETAIDVVDADIDVNNNNNNSIEVIVSDLENEIEQENNDKDTNYNYTTTCSTSSNSTLIQYAKATRSQNSFIKFNNKLRHSLERESSKNTSSYLMALLDLDSNCVDNKNYDVTSIIEEEDSSCNEKKKMERHHTQSNQFKMISFGVSGGSHCINSKSSGGIHKKANSELLELKLNIDDDSNSNSNSNTSNNNSDSMS